MTPRTFHRITRRTWRPRTNRKLRQRRPLRALIPSPRTVAAHAWQGLRRLAPTLAVAAGAAAVVAGGWAGYRFVTTSPSFAITTVEVRGIVHANRDELVTRASVHPGENIFKASPDAIEARIAASPWVASVRVRRRLPHRLVIDVTEHQPAAVVMLEGAYLADFDGRIFKRARLDGVEVDGLITLTGLDRRAWRADPAAGAAEIRRALGLAARWREQPGRPPLGEIHLDRSGTTFYTFAGAVAVRLSPDESASEALDRRLERFDVVWAALTPAEREAARTIHMDSATRPDRITVKLASASTISTDSTGTSVR